MPCRDVLVAGAKCRSNAQAEPCLVCGARRKWWCCWLSAVTSSLPIRWPGYVGDIFGLRLKHARLSLGIEHTTASGQKSRGNDVPLQ